LSIKQAGPLALIILDGFGYSPAREGNAIALAAMPFYHELLEKYPHTLLQASGECVGLPSGVMGNSNVGHLCMGAGRVLRTDVERINYEIKSGEFLTNPVLNHAMDSAVLNNRALHLMGLLSDGLVHSSQEHLYALLRMAHDKGLQRVLRPLFSGRARHAADVRLWLCRSVAGEVCGDRLRSHRLNLRALLRDGSRHALGAHRARLPSARLCRRRARDRSGRGDQTILRAEYLGRVLEPMVVLRETGEPVATIEEGDSCIFFNYRADRARQITSALTSDKFDNFDVSRRPAAIEYVCFAEYDKTFRPARRLP
jgi:2,3-bisphosphoglycerate-independent phosphoglycerate mutase